REALGADGGYGGERNAACIAQVLSRIELVTLQRGEAGERAEGYRRGEGSSACVGRDHDQTMGTRAPVQHVEECGVARERRACRYDQHHVLTGICRSEPPLCVEDGTVGPEVHYKPARLCRRHRYQYTCVPRAAAPAATRSSSWRRAS